MENETRIFWCDLKREVQERFARERKTTPEELSKDRNFECVPIALVEF